MSQTDSDSTDEQFFPTGLHALLRAQDWFSDLNPTVVSGPLASGKSNMGGLLGDCWCEEGGVVASTARSFCGTETVTCETDIADWAGSVDAPKLLIFEEFQLCLPFHKPGCGEQLMDIAEKWAEWGVKTVFITHDIPEFEDKDDVACFEMEDLKTAEVSGKVFCGGISELPQTSLTYDVAEMPEWTWDGGDAPGER